MDELTYRLFSKNIFLGNNFSQKTKKNRKNTFEQKKIYYITFLRPFDVHSFQYTFSAQLLAQSAEIEKIKSMRNSEKRKLDDIKQSFAKKLKLMLVECGETLDPLVTSQGSLVPNSPGTQGSAPVPVVGGVVQDWKGEGKVQQEEMEQVPKAAEAGEQSDDDDDLCSFSKYLIRF